MIQVKIAVLQFAGLCLLSSASWSQDAIIDGQTGVYVEQLTVNNTYSNAPGFPNRYRLDSMGDPDPEPGLSGSELDRIELFNTIAGTHYSIFASSNPSAVDIGEIVISGDGIVTVGRHNGPYPPQVGVSPGTAGCNNIDSIRTMGDQARLMVKINGDLTDMFAYQIAYLECDDILGDVVNNPSLVLGAPTAGRIECDNIVSGATVWSQVSSLSVVEAAVSVSGSVRATDGASLGNCTVGGTLSGTIEVTNGALLNQCDIGSVSVTGQVIASGDLLTCHVNGNMNGIVDVEGYFDECFITGDLVGSVDVEGDLRDCVITDNVSGTLDIAGEVFERVEVRTLDGGAVIVGGAVPTFRFTGDAYGGSITTGGEISLLEVQESWGATGASLSSYDPIALTVPQNALPDVSVIGDFIGDLPGYTLDRFFVNGNIYGYDLVSGTVVPSNISTSTNIRRFAAVESVNKPFGQDTTLLNLTTPTVGAFFVGAFFEEGLVNLTNGIDDEFVAKDGGIDPAAFRLRGGMGSAAHFHFGYDPSNPTTRMGIKSKLSFINFGLANNPVGPWDGEVSVGLSPTDPTRVLLDDDHHVLSVDTGGETFGNAPFNFHQRDTDSPTMADRECDPYFSEVVNVGVSTPTDYLDSIKISHYGPVFVADADGTVNDKGKHFRIEFKPDVIPSDGPTWFDRSEFFQVDIENGASGTSLETAHRVIVIKKADGNTNGFRASGVWRIRPKTIPNPVSSQPDIPMVRCGGIFVNQGQIEPGVEYESALLSRDFDDPTGDPHYWHTFRVLQKAPNEVPLLDGGNGPDSFDLTTWADHAYETNGDGQINSNDLLFMLENMSGN